MTGVVISIIGWVITILIAFATIRSSAKDTAKKIAALEESTAKQVRSVRRLAKFQIETSQIQINKELWEARMHRLQASQKLSDMSSINSGFNMVGDVGDFFRRQQEQESNLSYEREYQAKLTEVLEQYQAALSGLSKEIGGE